MKNKNAQEFRYWMNVAKKMSIADLKNIVRTSYYFYNNQFLYKAAQEVLHPKKSIDKISISERLNMKKMAGNLYNRQVVKGFINVGAIA